MPQNDEVPPINFEKLVQNNGVLRSAVSHCEVWQEFRRNVAYVESLGELGELYNIRVCGTKWSKLVQNCSMFFFQQKLNKRSSV